ncbi:baseplate assembly protein, partial [Enterobacter roggenkampii]
MTLYIGMNQDNRKAISHVDHLRQKVTDILLTPKALTLIH